LALFPRNPQSLLDVGRFEEAIAAAPDNALIRARTLEAQHRLEEALAWARPDWLRCSLLVQLSRFQEAEPLIATVPLARYDVVWQLIADGREAEGRTLLARLTGLRHPPIGIPQVAFNHFFLRPMLDNRDGLHVDPAIAWGGLLDRHRFVDMQWPWHLAAFLSDRIDEQGFRGQPFRPGIDQRLHLARGMKAELRRDWRGAADEYRACLRIPGGAIFGRGEGSDYVRWRLAGLERVAP
jgi:hypothetical protein